MRDFLLCSLKLLQNQKDNPTKGDFLDVIIKVIENIIMTDGALIKNDSTNKQKKWNKKKGQSKANKDKKIFIPYIFKVKRGVC